MFINLQKKEERRNDFLSCTLAKSFLWGKEEENGHGEFDAI